MTQTPPPPPPPPTPPRSVFARLSTVATALRPVLFGVLLVTIAALVVLFMQLRVELRSYLEEPVDNIHWNVTQLELDVVRLESQARLLLAQPGGNLAELRKRYDLFYSRAQSTLKGRMFTQLGMDAIVAPMTRRMTLYLDATTPLIDGDDTALHAALPLIVTSTAALREDLRTIAVELIDKSAGLSDQRRARFAGVLQQVAWASGAVLAVLILLLALVLGLNRRAERTMRETRAVSTRLAATVTTSLDAIIVANAEGRVLEFNEAASLIFGYTRAEAIGGRLQDLIVPPQHRQAHENGMERMNRTGEMRVVNKGRIQITAMRKSGEVFPVELSIASTEDDNGLLFISYLRDISNRVAAERAVIAARDKALAAEQAKTNFLAVMSHEMRTPLNGVMASLEIAARGTVDAKQARFLDLARSSARQLLRHADDVLDISRIDAGQTSLTQEDFDLGALVETLVDVLRQVAAEKGTDMRIAPLTPVPPLRGDSFRLGQIVQNFVSNAIKFTEQGRITVEYEVQDETPDQVTVELRVTDTGIGIAETDQARVFEDFVMIDPSYSRAAGGTGLGLAISRRLARAMQGEIGVESDPGAGSCFWLRIPFARGTSGADSVQGDAAVVAPGPLDILVVEDNATNRIVLEEMLTHRAHRVTLAQDGREGLEKAQGQRFDVILMDISMPKMDGLTATRRIRQDGLSRAARILAITAHSMPEDHEKIKAAGMDGALTKPITGAALDRALAAQPQGDLAGPAPQPGLLDPARRADLRAAMGEAGLSRILAQFQSDMTGLVSQLDVAAAAQDLPGLQRLAHEGAGAAAMVGASALARHFTALEADARAGRPAEAAARAGLVPALWQDTAAALQARSGG